MPSVADRVLRVLPSRERTAEVLRERVRGSGVALALGIIDLRSFEDRLIRATKLSPIGTTESRLVVTAVAPAAARGTTLASLATQPGFAEAFLELWDTLRRAGIDRPGFERLAERLSRRGRDGETSLTGRRFSALAGIAVAYEERLRARGVMDAVGARVRLPEAIAELGQRRLSALLDGARTISVEPGAEMPVVRARMWEALARAGFEVAVEIPVLPPGIDDVAPELLGSLEQLRRNLVDEAPSVGLIRRPLSGAQVGPLSAVGLMPFVSANAAREMIDDDVRERVELLDGEDERAALRGVCASIRELLHGGVPPHRITIAVPRLALARTRVLAALDAAELPSEESRGQPVIHAAPLRLTFALIDAAERELPREALAGVLESAYVARRDGTALLMALREAGSRDNRGIGHVGRLRVHADKLARASGLERERRLAKAERHRALAERWEPLFEKLRLRSEATLREHLDAVFSALRALGIPRRCLSLPTLGAGSRERRLERDAVAALARDRAALEALEVAGHGLDEAANTVGLAEEKISLTDFRAHLEAALAGVREHPAGVRGAGIAVRELAELARSPSDHVFVIHAVEGELPGPGRSLPFLDDEDRQALDRAAGRPVLGAPTTVDAGVFALACAGVRSRLTIATHRHDDDGREVMRSRWYVALARALAPADLHGNLHAHGNRPDSAFGLRAGSLRVPWAGGPRELEAGVVPKFSQCSTRGQLLTRLSMLARDGETRWEHPSLARALAWARTRSLDLARADVQLHGHALAHAHARLDFVWTGARADRPGLVWQGSATSLEDYAACPFRFFASRVLRLRERPPIRDELDAAEQGSIRHLVLAEVMQALAAEGLTPLEGGDRTGIENRRAREVCEAVLDRWQAHERTGPLPLWYLHRDLVVRDLSRTLEGERRAAIEAWEPGEFEVGFGVQGEDGKIEGAPLAIPDRRGERRFELVGRVDRIDYRGDGREREGLIIDYKSGSVGDRLRYLDLARTQLQLPLYAAWLAARRPELGDADAAYVSLRDGERSQASLLDLCLSSVELDGLLALDPNRRQELRERAVAELPASRPGGAEKAVKTGSSSKVGPPTAAAGALDLPETGQRNLADNVWALLGAIAEGRFDVRPFDPGRACRYCAYGPVCRVERGDELDEGDA